MERLLEVGLINALMATALAVLATLVGLVCRRPALVHALWLLVLLKLVTPPLVSVPVLLPAPPTERREQSDMIDSAPVPSSAAPRERVEDEMGMDVDDGAWTEDDHAAIPGREEEAVLSEVEAMAVAPVAEDRQLSWNWFNGLAWVWVIGSLSWFALASRRAWRFSRALRHARPSPALQARVVRLSRQIGLLRAPLVLLLPGRLAPLVWGCGKAVLVLPEGLETQVGESGLETLVLHELAHVHRRDHWVRWLEFLALGLYWWNPVVWYARRELREAEEQCCDAWVVRTLPGTGRAYATALVDALDFLSDARPALPPLASGLGQVADLKRRLTMILRGNTPARLGRSNGLAVCGLALLLLPLVPVWGQAQKESETVRERLLDALIERGAAPQGTDLNQLRAEIEKKVAELAALKAKLDALAKKAAAEALRNRAVERLRSASSARITTSGPVIRIEISGLDLKSDELKDLIKKLESVLPGKEKRVHVTVSPRPQPGAPVQEAPGSFYYRFRDTKDPTTKTPPTMTPANPRGNSGLPPGVKPGAPAPADKRIEGLEKKLDQLLRELESLRRDMRRGGSRGGAGGGFGGGDGGGSGRPGGGFPGNPGSGGAPGGTVPEAAKPPAGPASRAGGN